MTPNHVYKINKHKTKTYKVLKVVTNTIGKLGTICAKLGTIQLGRRASFTKGPVTP